MQKLELEEPVTAKELLDRLGVDGDLVLVYDRKTGKIANLEDVVYEPVVISKISGG